MRTPNKKQLRVLFSIQHRRMDDPVVKKVHPATMRAFIKHGWIVLDLMGCIKLAQENGDRCQHCGKDADTVVANRS